jgi:truncated hemoglobin YjbI
VRLTPPSGPSPTSGAEAPGLSLYFGEMPSLPEGEKALHRLEELFDSKALADPILKRLFATRQPHHVDHLTWFTAESFGGPDRFTRELGFEYMINVHRGPKITEEERRGSGSRRSIWRRSMKRGCPTMNPSARLCALTSSSGRRSRSRTHTPRRTPSSIRYARSRAGRGGRLRHLAHPQALAPCVRAGARSPRTRRRLASAPSCRIYGPFALRPATLLSAAPARSRPGPRPCRTARKRRLRGHRG